MDARRVRILTGSVFAATLMLSAFAAPVAAACALNAPASVDIGSPLTIEGSGFPANATVDISITIEGGSPDEFTTASDATGAFAINFTPEAADAGLTTVAASGGSGCSVQSVIAVGIEVAPAPVAPAPAATDEPGAEDAPPRTDGLEAPVASSSASGPWLLASVLFVLGLGGLYLTRPARSR